MGKFCLIANSWGEFLGGDLGVGWFNYWESDIEWHRQKEYILDALYD